VIHHLDAVRHGFDVDTDVVVIGSGAGGAVAAETLAKAGQRVVLLEAGPQVRVADMTRDGPAFLSKYYWEGGLRMLRGSGAWPAMSGRALGGSTVVNSAIMFALPDWVRELWIREDGLTHLRGDAFDRAYADIFARLGAAPTPPDALGTRNELTRDIMLAAGLDAKPLPRAVRGCKATGDCLTGCATGAKQSVDRVYVPEAVRAGAQVYTCCHVDRIVFRGTRAEVVEGHVVDPDTHVRTGAFRVRAKRVILAAGTMHTPVILLKSGVRLGGRVGGTFQAHIASFALGVMDRVVDPWVGATQGYGAFSDRVQGLKFEALWAPSSLIGAEWGPSGPEMYEQLPDYKRALMIPLVYRAKVRGRVRVRFDGMPDTVLKVPKEEVWRLLGEVKRITDAMLAMKAEYVYTGVWGVPERIRNRWDSDRLLSRSIRPRHLTMTCNHTFGSCRMSADPRSRVVDLDGKVDGVDNVWIADASIFPSPSAVNPQATVMALSTLVARGIAERS
jgi:choline dehydrogenase-like flavoprotein